jgi:hypothetical protein
MKHFDFAAASLDHTGKYYNGKKEAESSSLSYDKGVAARLWALSEKLTCSED